MDSLMTEELSCPGRSLDERIICTAQDGLGLAKGINLIGASLLAHVEILQEPIALQVQSVDILVSCPQFLLGACQVGLLLLKSRLQFGKSTLLVSESLGILCTLVSRVLHEGLIVLLGILLSDLSLGHFLVQILDEEIHHRDDAIALLGLLGVRLEGLRWRWRLQLRRRRLLEIV